MKNIAKLLTTILSTIIMTSCTISNASGKWENVLKDNSGNTVTTTVTITETLDNFKGSMETKVNGTLKVDNTNISFSGYVSNNVLVIEKLDNNSNPYFKSSTFTISEDGNTMFLSPSNLVFKKKK